MKKVTDELLFKTTYDYFRVYLPKMRKASENTIRSYRKTISSLFDYVAKKRKVSLVDLTFLMLDQSTISAYLDEVEKTGSSVTTRNQRLQAIRSFFTYAGMSNPALLGFKLEVSKIPPKKVSTKNAVNYMSESAMKAIFEQPDINTTKGFRNLFLMLLMYDSAARVQEIVDIRICDLTIAKTSTLLLHGKGSKDRVVPIMQTTLKQYDKYMNIFHPGISADSEEFLFFNERNGVKNRLDTSTVRKMVQKYGEMARETCPAVPKKVHPHLFRHSRAMHLYQHGMDLTLVSQWLGHAQLDTTLIYAFADTEQKRKAIEQATPANSILKSKKTVKRFVLTDDDLIKKLYGLS